MRSGTNEPAEMGDGIRTKTVDGPMASIYVASRTSASTTLSSSDCVGVALVEFPKDCSAAFIVFVDVYIVLV